MFHIIQPQPGGELPDSTELECLCRAAESLVFVSYQPGQAYPDIDFSSCLHHIICLPH